MAILWLLLGAVAGAAGAWALARRSAVPLQEGLKACEENLAKERVKIETLLQNFTDGLVLTNLRGEVLYINAEAAEILGAKPSDIKAANPGLFELTDNDRFRMKIQRILKTHTHSEVTELQVTEGDVRQTRYFKTTVKMFTLPDQGNFGVALLLRDVTGEKKLEALKEEFFHAVAHNLRAPLFAVQGYLRLLEQSLHPSKEQEAYFSALFESCGKLTLFVSDTLDSARIEAGSLKLSLTPVGPRALLERAVKLFSTLAQEKQIGLKLDLPAEEGPCFEADERLLDRVFYNLLSNAVKFTPAQGEIVVSMNQAGPNMVEFSVADTGPGIPTDQKLAIFRKHHQIDPDPKSGFGRGLNICDQIVKLHHGTIWVDTELGLGSQFIVRIPTKQPEAK